MTDRLKGKVALVTGACSGIGLGTVELFLAEGALLIAADMQDEKGAALEARFRGALRYVHCDVTAEADIAAACAAAMDAFGGLDVLFSNAGSAGQPGGAETMTVEGWDAVFALLVRAPALGIKHAAPLMAQRGGGSIINTASIAGLEAGWGPLAYSTAKAAVIHMSRCAAADLATRRIRVNAICPGMIATSIFGTAIGLPRERADQMAAHIAESAGGVQPIPVAGLPSDIAAAALYLASDESRFVTGTHLVVDGGITVGDRHAWDPSMPSPFAKAMGIDPEALQAALAGPAG